MGGAAATPAAFGAALSDGAVPWYVLVALLAAVVAVVAAGGSCLAALVAAGVARARRRSGGGKGAAVNGAAAPWPALMWPWRPRALNGAAAAAAAAAAPPPARAEQQHHTVSPPPGPASGAAAAANARGHGAPGSHPLALDAADDGDEFDLSEGWFDRPHGPGPHTPAAAAAAAAPPPDTPRRARPRARARGAALAAAAGAAVKAVDNGFALLASLPRTLRTLAWAVSAGVSYKRYQLRTDPLMDPEGFQKGLTALHDYWAEQLTEVCRLNGGVYIKTGQFAGAFNSMPPEYKKHLALLQDRAKPRPFATVNRVLRCELGASAEEVFAEFSAEATAAASLAQVHKARLEDGREVAVKIQYPGLRGAADADLWTLSLLSQLAAAAFPHVRLSWLYRELKRKLEEELDFGVEVAHSRRLLSQLSPSLGVALPEVHLPLCTSKILVMEWIHGYKVNDARALRRARISPRAVGVRLERAFAEMTFVHGYLHADPHPGNIMRFFGGAAAAGGRDDALSDASGDSGGGGGGGRGGGAASRAGYRLKIQSRLALIQGYTTAGALLSRALLAALHLFGQNVPLS
ncbi:hypothetical protein Rsub_12079 [Raphidocelis subcapitata]|uniref:ABC1 atypical kinase-like domain-containing protein n=1 Tax=Raphidocelis subcapitata TaxID=307507 RepID=A0A2V0PHK3_9CHLO|nr:hypothetical protein Rsub_12079 [Raphidocelis subcapitata]|eukprot:GBF99298.1 hypothetical protein Rsub_12079 [Raphidocelis subcapitata]